jgi:hypothetical protein
MSLWQQLWLAMRIYGTCWKSRLTGRPFLFLFNNIEELDCAIEQAGHIGQRHLLMELLELRERQT